VGQSGTLKGLVLSGGKGSRLRPFTYSGAKQLVPIANKPILFYALENLVHAGITEIAIVVGETAEEVMRAVGTGERFEARITYIKQDQPIGIAHGIKIARDFLGDDPFVLFLGDNFIKEGIDRFVQCFREQDLACQILLSPVPNPQDFGVAIIEEGKVVRLIEKPKEPPTNLAVTGIYMFGPCVHEAVDAIRPSQRGELEITDTIQFLIDAGLPVRAQPVQGSWIDTGKMDDILEANRILLDDLEPRIEGAIDGQSKLYGRVVLEAGAEVVNSVIRGPAIIGERTRIENAYIGSYTSIYHDCIVQDSEINHSVVLEHTTISGIHARIEDSLIGRNVILEANHSRPRALKAVLGDYSRTYLP
jgi:glucose-1-phosphate thymidylyltransferase